MTAAEPRDEPALSPLGRWLSWRPPEWDEATRRQVLDELFFEDAEWRPFLLRFATLLILSTTIAGLGLISDSSAVVIGAMLVAPLMTPILAVAAAAVHGQLHRLGVSASVLIAGTITAVATGWLIGWIAPGTITVDELTSQLLARTAPCLVDLGVAVAAGLAGGYVLTHPRAGSSLPGVAIHTRQDLRGRFQHPQVRLHHHAFDRRRIDGTRPIAAAPAAPQVRSHV